MNVRAPAMFPTGYLQFRFWSSVCILYKGDTLAVYFFFLMPMKKKFQHMKRCGSLGVCVYINTSIHRWMKDRKQLGSGVYLEKIIAIKPLVLCSLCREAL